MQNNTCKHCKQRARAPDSAYDRFQGSSASAPLASASAARAALVSGRVRSSSGASMSNSSLRGALARRSRQPITPAGNAQAPDTSGTVLAAHGSSDTRSAPFVERMHACILHKIKAATIGTFERGDATCAHVPSGKSHARHACAHAVRMRCPAEYTRTHAGRASYALWSACTGAHRLEKPSACLTV